MPINDIIAVVVSDNARHALDFLQKRGLNPESFKIVTDENDLRGYSSSIPVILTYGSEYVCTTFIKYHFDSVRYMDY
jgi:hypothetical protein